MKTTSLILKISKKLFICAGLVAVLFTSLPKQAEAQNCNHSWQTASDGSNCGGRAADQRPGGRP